MLTFTKLAVKLSVVGGAVYLTANSQYWSNRSEYSIQAIESVKKSMPDTVELFNQLPSSKKITEKWNQTIESTFEVISDPKKVSNCVNDKMQRIKGFLDEQSKK